MQGVRTQPAIDWRLLGRVVILVGSALTLALAVVLAMRVGLGGWHDAVDAYNYWRAWDGGLYDKVWFGGAYIYSPVVAQLLWPFTLLPFEAFRGLLMVASIGALYYMVGPYGIGFVALLFPGVIADLGVGSPHLLMGAALVAGVRGRLWAWSVLPLTKVTPSVAALWLLRDRRELVRALGIGLAICAVSFALAPGLWFEWARLLLDATGRVPPNTDPMVTTIPLVARLPVAIAIAALATWRSWPWLLPVAAVVALPIVWIAGTAMLVACLPLSPLDRHGVAHLVKRRVADVRGSTG